MASTEERLRQLADENLEVDGQPVGKLLDLDKGLADVGVSSMDAVSFAKVLEQEFNVSLLPDKAGEIQTIGDLIAYLEANAS
ncbi:MAG: acyl carrier protein [Candidatus Dadabacteria bacterium]|nr:acyl carrier protein [Candidatus Dadabacteria bacterium]MXZ13680.1 acyl carrier protein [Candidatus Dadabacteria bacterium]MYA48206.1 acyl carrier protein [Candidatus Dadabacteria bacterium]MYC40422.1 acyl carrier protein [Candidatus Dadabacteria bacterium]MYF48029.1 acyl carrier protein [Candidatus Dadabacteria bacterium]